MLTANKLNRPGALLTVLIFCALASCARAATFTNYVRGDGLGNDSNAGTNWAGAFATIQRAVNGYPVPYAGSMLINVQASASNEAYDVVARSTSYSDTANYSFDMTFEGGWENVDVAPTQTATSVIKDKDGTIDETGLKLTHVSHHHYNTVSVNRFVFTNVLYGVWLENETGDLGNESDGAPQQLWLRNSDIYAKSNGVYLNYPKGRAPGSYGGVCSIYARDVTIAGGLGGGGVGVKLRGAFNGSYITAGTGNVSVVRGAGGAVWAWNSVDVANNLYNNVISISNVVMFGGSGPAVYIDGYNNQIQAILKHCTVADTGGDGLRMVTTYSSLSSVTVQDCIFANNAGHGVNLGNAGAANFSLTENYNEFYNDDIYTNAGPKTLSATDRTTNPFFYTSRPLPEYYKLKYTMSPCYRRASDGSNIGAWQNIAGGSGFAVTIK